MSCGTDHMHDEECAAALSQHMLCMSSCKSQVGKERCLRFMQTKTHEDMLMQLLMHAAMLAWSVRR